MDNCSRSEALFLFNQTLIQEQTVIFTGNPKVKKTTQKRAQTS
jgi:hypothetical protein